MLSKDLLLDAHHDLVIENFDLKLTDIRTSVAQRIKQTLLTIKGEWFLDEELGIPYQEIFGQKDSVDALKATLINHIAQIEGVKKILDLQIKEDREQRIANIEIKILDIFDNELYINL